MRTNKCPTGSNNVNAAIVTPTLIRSLKCYDRVKQLDGGNINSVAVTESRACLTWSCIDNFATGLAVDSIPTERTILDAGGRKEDTDQANKNAWYRCLLGCCRRRTLSRCYTGQQSLQLGASAWEVAQVKERTILNVLR